MPQNINLLTDVQSGKRKRAPFSSISVIILLLTILFAVISLLYTLFLKATIATVSDEETNTLTSMQKLSEKKVKLLTIHERSKVIQSITPQNALPPQRLKKTLANLPFGITVSSVQMLGDTVSLTVSSSTLGPLNTFLNNNLQEVLKTSSLGVKKIGITSFGFTQDNLGYQANILITYNTRIN